MKKELQDLLDKCLQNGTDEDFTVLQQLIEGVRKKQTGEHSTYIGGYLQLNREITETKYEMTMPISPLMDNSLGIVHGGMTATLLDTAMGTLANYTLPEGYGCVTSQLNIHYIATGKGKELRCEASIIHSGSKSMVIKGEVFRDDGTLIAYATGTFFVIKMR